MRLGFCVYLPSKFFGHRFDISLLRAQLFGAVASLAAAWAVNLGILANDNTNLVANLETPVYPPNSLLCRNDNATDMKGKLLLYTVRLLRQCMFSLSANPSDMSAQYPEVANSSSIDLLSVQMNVEYRHSVKWANI